MKKIRPRSESGWSSRGGLVIIVWLEFNINRGLKLDIIKREHG